MHWGAFCKAVNRVVTFLTRLIIIVLNLDLEWNDIYWIFKGIISSVGIEFRTCNNTFNQKRLAAVFSPTNMYIMSLLHWRWISPFIPMPIFILKDSVLQNNTSTNALTSLKCNNYLTVKIYLKKISTFILLIITKFNDVNSLKYV